ncbi:SPW repeat protein [candidate division WOR-3 bacterium]|nr:SPW repeat protein [candidate division WOR-3 bacterium]
MWQCWLVFYMGLWVMISGWIWGGVLKWSNVVFGFFIALFSAWCGIKAYLQRKEKETREG